MGVLLGGRPVSKTGAERPYGVRILASMLMIATYINPKDCVAISEALARYFGPVGAWIVLLSFIASVFATLWILSGRHHS